MPAPTKLLHVLGLLGAIESTYGTAVALTTTASGIQLQYKDQFVAAPMDMKYAFDGSLGPAVGNLGQVERVSPSGLYVEGDLPTRARGGGAAYSATVTPSVHVLLQAAGFSAAVSTTTASEKWTYTPTAPGNSYASMTTNLYTRGELWTAVGALCDLKIDFADPAPPIWTFPTKAIVNGLPTDATAPAITYPLQTVLPPLATSIALTLGNFTTNAVVMNGSFVLQRALNPRVALSAAGAFLGYVPGERKPLIKIEVEATALQTTPFTSAAGFDPYNLQDKATIFAFALQFGSTQYNKYTINLPQAQVIDVVPKNNKPVATVELTIAGGVSAPQNADDINIVFN